MKHNPQLAILLIFLALFVVHYLCDYLLRNPDNLIRRRLRLPGILLHVLAYAGGVTFVGLTLRHSFGLLNGYQIAVWTTLNAAAVLLICPLVHLMTRRYFENNWRAYFWWLGFEQTSRLMILFGSFMTIRLW